MRKGSDVLSHPSNDLGSLVATLFPSSLLILGTSLTIVFITQVPIFLLFIAIRDFDVGVIFWRNTLLLFVFSVCMYFVVLYLGVCFGWEVLRIYEKGLKLYKQGLLFKARVVYWEEISSVFLVEDEKGPSCLQLNLGAGGGSFCAIPLSYAKRPQFFNFVIHYAGDENPLARWVKRCSAASDQCD